MTKSKLLLVGLCLTLLLCSSSARAHQFFEETECESAKESATHLLKRKTLNHKFTAPTTTDVELINAATEKAVRKARQEALRNAKNECYYYFPRCEEIEFSILKLDTEEIDSNFDQNNRGLELQIRKTAEVEAKVKVVVRGTKTPEDSLPKKAKTTGVRVSYFPEID